MMDRQALLKSIPDGEAVHISATALANALGMGEVQVRKDLAMVSSGGRPKVGYVRESLIDDIEQFLGYDNTTDAVLIGAGKLGPNEEYLKKSVYIGLERIIGAEKASDSDAQKYRSRVEYELSTRGIFVGYSWAIRMYRVCVGNVSGMYRECIERYEEGKMRKK